MWEGYYLIRIWSGPFPPLLVGQVYIVAFGYSETRQKTSICINIAEESWPVD
jgi:hypothetical protein